MISLLAIKYDGQDTGVINDQTNASVGLGALSVNFSNITVTGSVVTKLVTAKDGSEVNLSKVKIKGTATTTP